MRFQSILAPLVLALPVLSSPIPTLDDRQLLAGVPLGLVDLQEIVIQVRAVYDTLICKTGFRSDCIGDAFNKYTGFANTLDATIGYDNVVAIDVLADRLCIASGHQGSICDELLGYAYAWYVAQQQGYTYRQIGQYLGANNMKAINDDLGALCLEPDGLQNSVGFCRLLLGDTDTLANSIVSQDDLTEDNNNSNTLDYLGLSKVLPKPQPLGV